MTNQVNPPPQLRIPESLASDRDSFGYLRQVNQILFQLWVKTGGSDVLPVEFDDPQFQEFEDLSVKYPRSRNVVSTSADYTTIDNDTVVCTNASPITVTLNGSPDDLELVTVKMTVSRVNISGNGKTIDGNSTVMIDTRYHSLDLIYTLDTDSWSII
jgi:hypothetical protein